MRRALWFVGFSSALLLGACVADMPEITSNGGSADAGASDGDATKKDDASVGTSKDGGSSFGPSDGDDGGAPGSNPLSSNCATIDGGSDLCSGSAPICCAVQDPGGGFGSVTFQCAASNASCASLDVGVAITCRQPSDCASGSVCCGRKSATNSSVFVSVKCETSCEGASSFGHVVYCDPNDAHTCDGTNAGTTPFCEPSDFPGMFDCENE